jgi:hypothetical protein
MKVPNAFFSKLLLPIIIILLSNNTFGQAQRNLLQNIANKSTDEKLLSKDFKPYAAYSDRVFWNAMPDEIKTECIEAAQKSSKYQFGTVPLTTFLAYKRNGNRTENEAYYNTRRDHFRNLVLGELMEGKGRFLDAIMDASWSVCEQTFWGISAHLPSQKAGAGIPDVNEPIIDLVVGEMGNLMSWTYYFFNKEFDKTSPLISQRIKLEINKKVIQPYLLRDDFWWQATKPGVMVNNWNPWCNFNVLSAALLTSDDYALKVKLMRKTMISVDQFINYYKSDGGCEEGPSYWDHAAGKMLEYLELMDRASYGNVNVFDNTLIKRMGLYIALAHIGQGYYINFADASAFNKGLPDIIYRYGKSINDTNLKSFGAYVAQNTSGMPILAGTLEMSLQKYLIWDEMMHAKAAAYQPAYFWLDGIEVAGIRSEEGTNKGFFFAAKGGFNNESHNHNDVGTFVLYYNNDPILIDAGVGTYTAKTFSNQRYDIWTMQSAYHNLPMTNGFQQSFGTKFKSSDVTFKNEKSKAVFSLNIAKAYPAAAKCKTWMRSYSLDRKKGLTIEDQFEFDSLIENNTLNLLVAGNIHELSKGELQLCGKKEKLILSYNPEMFNYTVEEITLDDSRLSNVWGKSIHRLVLFAKDKTLNGIYKIIIRP